LPIKKPECGTVVGVLNIDALTREAAGILKAQKESLESHKSQALVDLVSYVSLFYA